MTYQKYREIEGPLGNSPADRMAEAIEAEIFSSKKIDSIDAAVQYAYARCRMWE